MTEVIAREEEMAVMLTFVFNDRGETRAFASQLRSELVSGEIYIRIKDCVLVTEHEG